MRNNIFHDPFDPDGRKARRRRRNETIRGIIIYAAIVILVGLFFRWLMTVGLYDGSYDPLGY